MSARRILVAATVAVTAFSFSGTALAAPPTADKKPQAVRDGDRDGMPDAYEKANELNPCRNDAERDKDSDGRRAPARNAGVLGSAA